MALNNNAININAGFEVGSQQPLDSRQWLSTAEMKNVDVNIMPDPYYAINKEDHFLYIFSKTNSISESTGYFTKYTSDGGMTVWKGSETERDALPEETKADESIIFYTWDTDSAEYKNVVSKTVGTVENMSEADYQALETKDARTIYTTPGHIRVGEESIVNDYNKFAKKLQKTAYYAQGCTLQNIPGYLLTGGIPRKIVAIGNSLTGIPSQYTLEDGTEVDESREYGTTYANKGWTNLVYSWLKNIFDSEDINFYKALVRPWEDGTAGSRSYDLIKNQPAYRVEVERTFNANKTLDEILDEDVDVIFLNAGENIANVSTSSDITSLTTDYNNLIQELATKCPNARLYVFGLWWKNEAKSTALINAMTNPSTLNRLPVQMMYNVAWTGYIDEAVYKYSTLNHIAGDEYYKLDGSLLGTYTEGASANHPNDLGYLTRAILAIYNLMWQQGKNQKRFCPTNTSDLEHPNSSLFNFNTTTIRTVDNINSVFSVMMLPPGIWNTALNYPYKNSTGSIAYAGQYVNVEVDVDYNSCYVAKFKPLVSANVLSSKEIFMQKSWIADITLQDCLA